MIGTYFDPDAGWTPIEGNRVDRILKRDVVVRVYRHLAPVRHRVGHAIIGQEICLLLIPEYNRRQLTGCAVDATAGDFEAPPLRLGPKVGQVDERFKQRFAVWLVRDAEGIYALSTVCTHLGCTPNWLEAEQKFKCPCHGSGYYKSGVNFEGPTPRPLERFTISLADDGQILVDKSRKFQQEKGEWSNPASFLKLN